VEEAGEKKAGEKKADEKKPGEKRALMHGENLIAEAEPALLDFDLPPPVSLEDARAAEAGSPAHYNETGVHPRCFGCGNLRQDGLRIFVGPIQAQGQSIVAGRFDTTPFREADGSLPRAIVLAALDCPGAFAFIVDQARVGLLGRIVFESYAPVPVDEQLIVTANRLGKDGRKHFAGTALYDPRGTLLAAAKATWFA
jgi:hypothetical protein